MRMSVDFPQPEGPITLMNSRWRTSKLTFESATVGAAPEPLNSRVSPSMLITTGRARSSEMRCALSGGWSR